MQNNINPKKMGGGPSTIFTVIFLICKDLAAQFYDFFALKYHTLFETKFVNIRHSVTNVHNVFYVHVDSKNYNFHNLCTNPMENMWKENMVRVNQIK